MAYDTSIADRVTDLLTVRRVAFHPKAMFGGLCFMVNDKMCLGVMKAELMVRLDPAVHEAALQQPGCSPMEFTGRSMKGFVFVQAAHLDSEAQLRHWVDLALEFNPGGHPLQETLPASLMMTSGKRSPSVVADDLFRREGARLVASLAAHLGTHRLQLAEDVVQEALVRALQTWPYRGIPDNPAAWLTQAAKNLALDALRREQTWQRKEAQITAEQERWLARDEPPDDQLLTDDTLRLLFVCFHPQLSIEAQLALALRTVAGLSPAEIGVAVLTSEAAIAKRLVRARQLIRDLRLPFAVPDASELPQRLDGVLAALYLLFNEGYKASSGGSLVRETLCHEAIRLVTLLAGHPSTQAPRTYALLALMLFNAARLAARADDAGNLLRLHEQDRQTWDQTMIQRGIQCLAHAAQGDTISEYHLEAGIAACHSTASDDANTNWPRILALYDHLITLTASPIAAMNRAVAVARVHGPQAGMAALDAITDRSKLEANHLFHVIRGTFAAGLGHQAAALAHFQHAGHLASLPAERDFIARRVHECATTSDATSCLPAPLGTLTHPQAGSQTDAAGAG